MQDEASTIAPDKASTDDVESEDLLETEQNPLPQLAEPEDPKESTAAAVEAASEIAPEATSETAPEVTAPEATAEPEATTKPAPVSADPHPLDAAQHVLGRLRDRMRAQVLGRDDVIDLVLVALLADGHVLLEDFPGSGKTTLAKSLGTSITEAIADVRAEAPVAPFRRIQFTPDLLQIR
ncbi:MAG: hypothetical protein AAFY88_17570, partial [Acidobacteriota bacterium]